MSASISIDGEYVIVNGVKYIKEPIKPTGVRRIFVIDSGWIVCGDIVEEKNNITLIDRVVHIQKWSEVWFKGMVANPTSNKVSLAKMDQKLEIPSRAVLFRVVVKDDWGLE